MGKREKTNVSKKDLKNKKEEEKVEEQQEEQVVKQEEQQEEQQEQYVSKEEVSINEEDVSLESDEEEELNDTKGNKKNSRIRALEKTLETLETNDKNNGVIYIGHLPWGFEDKGIRKYFEQFGKITRIMVPKSKKTGRVKGYGFVEFEDKGVAHIAAKTMNNYILFDKILKCSVVDDSSRYNLIFKKWKRNFKFNDKYKKYLQEKNKFKTRDEVKEHVKLLLEKEEAKRNKLAELGIKYEFPGFKALIEKHRQTIAATETKKAQPTKTTVKTRKSK